MPRLRDRLPPAVRDRPVTAAVLLVAAFALALRLWALGWRTAHWDEGRVGMLVVEYVRSGAWTYDAIVHGPFLFHVDRWLFTLVGTTDFVARLPVALVGAVLPLSALLFRDRLPDDAVVALAALLATNPLLLYYSRFMRNDVLVGGFALLALGFFVRAYDRGSRRAFYAGVAAFALAATTKANFLVYLGMWVGALALLVDYRLYHSDGVDDLAGALRDLFDRGLASLAAWRVPLLVGAVEFVAVIVVFYAPRPDFYRAFTDPSRWPAVLEAATVVAWRELWGTWVAGGTQDHGYLPYLRDYLETLAAGAAVVVALAAVGFVLNRYARERRPLVEFAGYWGAASLLVYPLATDIQAPWTAVHTVLPLTVPAALALAVLVRRVRESGPASDTRAVGALLGLFAVGALGAALLDAGGVGGLLAGDLVSVGGALVVLWAAVGVYALTGPIVPAGWRPTRAATTTAVATALLLVLGAQVATTGHAAVYQNPHAQADFVQYGQPAESLDPALAAIRPAVDANDGVDVVFYGQHFYSGDAIDHTLWRNPFPWYLGAYGANVTSVRDVGAVTQTGAPVVVAPSGPGVQGVENASDLTGPLSEAGYRRVGEFPITQRVPGSLVNAVVWVRDGGA